MHITRGALLGASLTAISSSLIPDASLQALSVIKEESKQVSKPFVEAAKSASPCVVSIKAQMKPSRLEKIQDDARDFLYDDFWDRFFGAPPRSSRRQKPEPSYGFGSGFIVSKDGYIMTNNHVVENATRITVQLTNGKEYVAKKVGSDPSTDIALLKIEEKNLPSLEFADSSKLEIGEWIVVIGNPLALRTSVTTGVVSALGRSDLNIMRIEEFIQTDAAINKGNSGGPVINLDGKVVGMATAILSSSADGGNIGIGFAISSKLLQEVMKDIIEHGQPSRGYLGFSPQTIDDEMAKALGLSNIQGALVAEVSPNSPAADAGLQAGDVILKVNGEEITSAGNLRRAIAVMKPGQTVRLDINRNGKEISINATIGSNPHLTSGSVDSVEEMVGIAVEPISPELQKMYNLDVSKGLLIVDIDTDSTAYEAGLRAGCIILSVNGTSVSTKDEFQKAVQDGMKKKKLLLQVKAGQIIRFVPIRVND